MAESKSDKNQFVEFEYYGHSFTRNPIIDRIEYYCKRCSLKDPIAYYCFINNIESTYITCDEHIIKKILE